MNNIMTVTEQLAALGLQLDRKSRNSMRLDSIDNSLKIDGFSFPSDAEKRRYIELKLLEQRREIFDLLVCGAVGISYPLKDGKRTLSYQPTFTYSKQGERVFEDVRKMQSETNKRKIQMMKDQHQIEIKVI
ncbi:MAG: DUF1064 domain-containing protein [Acidobacteriota bacterium]|nr:DUF1064 domain-containing protein [Acidobacteriota bacterium]